MPLADPEDSPVNGGFRRPSVEDLAAERTADLRSETKMRRKRNVALRALGKILGWLLLQAGKALAARR